jgi:hypothetical protein
VRFGGGDAAVFDPDKEEEMNPMKPAAILVLATACGAAGAWAQAAASGKPMPAKPQGGAGAAAAPMPMAGPQGPPKPNPALDQLKYFAGSWQCAGTGYLEGKAHPTSGKVKMDWDLNGFFMGMRYEEAKTEVNPMPITAVEHWGYSDELKQLVAGQVDSMGGYGTQASAGWQDGKMVWTGTYHTMGTTMPSRDTFVKQGDNEVRHLGETQSNGAWTKLDEETCYRLQSK